MTISNVGQKGYFPSTSISQSPSKGVIAWMPTRQVPGTQGWCRGCGGVLLTVLLLCQDCSTSQLLLFGIIILSFWHFQIAGTFCCCWISLLPVASPGISSGTLVLSHGPESQLPPQLLQSWPSTATEAVPSPMALSSAKSQLLPYTFMPLNPVPAEWCLHITTFGCKQKMHHCLHLELQFMCAGP